MRIAFLSFYSGMNQRGVERWVFELASRLSAEHKVIVFQNKPAGFRTDYNINSTDIGYNNSKRSQNWLFKHLFIDYDSLKVFVFTLKILSALLKENYDIIIPTDGGWEPAIIRIVTWIKRNKMVIVGHAGIGWDDANNLWSFPDVFVVLSSFAKKWARRINPFIRVEYIPDAVDLTKFCSGGNKINLQLKKPVALCVSALERGKRIDLIIKAVAKTDNLSLLICGRGELKEEISSLGVKLLGSRFEMKEFNFEKMPEVYRSCELFLSASLPYHSFEMVLLEAMASNLPVVANDDPIRREIVGSAGIFTDPVNTKDFLKAIERVMNTNWGSKPLSQAKEYSWDKIIKMYLSLFKRL